MDRVTSPADLVQHAIARNPDGQRFLAPLLSCFTETHWGAVRAPGTLRAPESGTFAREVALPPAFIAWAATHTNELQGDPATSPVDQQIHLDCCLETDTFVLALEDATAAPLETGTPAYAARHRLSRVIEAVRAIAAGRLFAVAVVASPGFVEPRRAAILEGLPHIEREEAEDLYAAYWGWCTPDQLAEALDGA